MGLEVKIQAVSTIIRNLLKQATPFPLFVIYHLFYKKYLKINTGIEVRGEKYLYSSTVKIPICNGGEEKINITSICCYYRIIHY